MSGAPRFPPLFQGEACTGDPMVRATARAIEGCDAGLVVHAVDAQHLRAAAVFAPEVPLAEAMTVFIAAGIGFQNALGALAPPEIAVHLTWSGGISVNGAACGRLRACAETQRPEAEPAWLVIGLEVPLAPEPGLQPGDRPGTTFLSEEGCLEVAPIALLEAWVRHMLVWINRMEDGGTRALHAEWEGLVQDMGQEVTLDLAGQSHRGVFTGVDERFGMLLKDTTGIRLVPLTACLEERP